MQITRRQPVTEKKLQLARKLRKAMKPQERNLWRALRGDQLAGLHFRRQQVVAGFIVDFYCASARLAIEIDGDSHLARAEYDAARDQVLCEMGIRTLRIRNEAVAADLRSVLRQIIQATSPLAPLPAGEGNSERKE